MTRRSREHLRSPFWALPAVAVGGGVLLGIALPVLDRQLTRAGGVGFGGEAAAARAILQTIATLTVSIVGLAFSVTLVALQLASQQLSPRVLRTFRRDRLNQATLAAFLGTAAYAVLVLRSVRTGEVPDLSVTAAFVFFSASLILFIAFINNIVNSLQPAHVVQRILRDGLELLERRDQGAQLPWRPLTPAATARASHAGFLEHVDAERAARVLARAGAVAWQRAAVGDYLVSGDALAEVHAPDAAREEATAAVAGVFRIGPERSLAADPAFPIRQLADIALRALSPSLNDPTTAENALGAITELLIRARDRPLSPRAVSDAEGVARLVLLPTEFDALVRLAFAQVCGHVGGDVTLALRVLGLLERVGGAEATRQADVLAERFGQSGAPAEERARVRAATVRLGFPPALHAGGEDQALVGSEKAPRGR